MVIEMFDIGKFWNMYFRLTCRKISLHGIVYKLCVVFLAEEHQLYAEN